MQESGEMYLETILVLSREKNLVRAVDIVNYMGYSKASVSRALARLREENCIIVDGEGRIALTGKGADIADKIYERHVVLSDMLQSLGVSRDTAMADACKIEHDISDETFEAIKAHAEKHKK